MDNLVDVNRRLDNIDAQLRALADHLGIVLMYQPQKYEIVTKKELEKTIGQVPSIARG